MTKSFALAIVLALAVAGCGGGGSKGLSKEEYGSKLNQICAGYQKTVAKAGQLSSPADVATKGPTLVAAFDKALAQAKALEPPSSIKGDADTFIAEYEELRDLVVRIVAAAKRQDTAKIIQLAGQAEPLAKDTRTLGKKLGAPACGASFGAL